MNTSTEIISVKVGSGKSVHLAFRSTEPDKYGRIITSTFCGAEGRGEGHTFRFRKMIIREVKNTAGQSQDYVTCNTCKKVREQREQALRAQEQS